MDQLTPAEKIKEAEKNAKKDAGNAEIVNDETKTSENASSEKQDKQVNKDVEQDKEDNSKDPS